MMCEAMDWNHLPMAGGLYDQNPELLERWRYLFTERSRYEEIKRKEEQRKGPQQRGRGMVAGSRRR
jgi:hypothetical protein